MKSFLGLVIIVFSGLSFAATTTAPQISKRVFRQNIEERDRKTINFSLNPLTTLAGLPIMSFDFRLGSQVTLGPTLGYFGSLELSDVMSPLIFGLNFNLFLNDRAFKDAWIWNVNYMTISVASTITAKATLSALTTTLDYSWFWNNGFNLGTGFGILQGGGRIKTVDTSYEATSAAFPWAKVSLGWAF
jgi:hypothetical protein